MKIRIISILIAILGITQTACAQGKIKTDMEQKVLVAFFSRADENYNVGYIEKGNTHIVAEIIAEKMKGELFHIKTVTPYAKDYKSCIETAKKEKETNARPPIKGDIAVEDYDLIFIGYPNWWGDMPMAVYTFLEKHNWQGKTVIPFCTHEGSGLAGTERKLGIACKGVTLLKGIAIQGSVAQNSKDQASQSVVNWLKKLKLNH